MKVNILEHITSEDLTCNICNKTLSSLDNLQYHTNQVHKNKQEFKCTTCHRLFSTKSNLNTHVQAVHEKKSQIYCNICRKNVSKNNYKTPPMAKSFELQMFTMK